MKGLNAPTTRIKKGDGNNQIIQGHIIQDKEMLGDSLSETEMKNLSPDDDIIPKVDLEEVPTLVQRLYGIKVSCHIIV